MSVSYTHLDVYKRQVVRSCTEKATMVPKEMTLASMGTTNDQYLGCLIKVPNAEFDAKVLCSCLLYTSRCV